MKPLKSIIALGLVFSILLLALPVSAATGTAPVNPNASDEAKELLQTLYNIRGKGIISGIYNWHEIPEERTDKLYGMIGEYAGIWNTNFGYGGEVGDEGMRGIRNNVIATAKRHAAAGDIVSLMWHAVKPSDSEWAGWNSVMGDYTDQEYDLLLTEGTTLHNQLLAQLDDIAGYLKELQEENIPVLWRPYHEANGGWFWWGGKNGGARFVKLWKIMYDRYTNYHGLDNLIWVWNISPASISNMLEYYPGNAYVDVVSIDIYEGTQYDQETYENLKVVANGKPIALGEVGVLPDMDYLKEHQSDYVFFIEWADWLDNGDQTEDWIRTVFHDDYCYNRGDIPDSLPDVDGPGILPDLNPSDYEEISLVEAGTKSVTLTWKCLDTRAAGYKIFLNNKFGEQMADVWVGLGNGGTTTITGLNPDTWYTFFFQAYGDASSGYYWYDSNKTITVKTLAAEPGAPFIKSIVSDDTSITVSLENTDATAQNHITVYNTDEDNTIVYDADFTGASVTVADLKNATNYKVVVSSKTGSFDDLEGTTQTMGIKTYDVTASSVTLRWSDFFPEGAFYKVVWSGGSADVYGLETTIDGLSANTDYKFTVWGIDSDWGWTGGSREVSVKTLPLEVPNITAVSATESDFTVALGNVLATSENHIVVYNLDEDNRTVYDADFTGTSVTVPDCDFATQYRFVVTSRDGAFQPLSGEAQTQGVKVLSATSTGVTLRWHDFYPDRLLYKLSYVVNGQEKQQDVYGLETTIDGLAPDTSYSINIWAVASNYNWMDSRTIDVKTSIAENKILSVGNGTVQMQIDDAAALSDYTLIVASYKGGALQKAELFAPNTSVSYTQVDCDEVKAFLWNMKTLTPYINE